MKKRVFIFIASCLLLLVALGITFYPLISTYVNEKYQSLIQTQYEECVEELDDARLAELWQAAVDYNNSLSEVQYSREGLHSAAVCYEDVLNPNGSGIMGYVEIPKISVNLPIYHNADMKTLEDGAGHLLGSSLPIGGEGTHSVLSAHSGVAGKKLFSDLDQLAEGDVFYLHVLTETLAYQVDQIHTVLPQDSSLLNRTASEDRCTLVTCTPFGVNTHRLLVQGVRIPYEKAIEETAETVEAPSTWNQQYICGLLIGGAIFVACLTVFVVICLVKRKKRK